LTLKNHTLKARYEKHTIYTHTMHDTTLDFCLSG